MREINEIKEIVGKALDRLGTRLENTEFRKLSVEEYMDISKICYQVDENKRFNFLALRDALLADVGLGYCGNVYEVKEFVFSKIDELIGDKNEYN